MSGSNFLVNNFCGIVNCTVKLSKWRYKPLHRMDFSVFHFLRYSAFFNDCWHIVHLYCSITVRTACIDGYQYKIRYGMVENTYILGYCSLRVNTHLECQLYNVLKTCSSTHQYGREGSETPETACSSNTNLEKILDNVFIVLKMKTARSKILLVPKRYQLSRFYRICMHCKNVWRMCFMLRVC